MAKKYLLFLLIPILCLAIWDFKIIEDNHWHFPITNYGIFGADPFQGGSYWPRPLRNYYIFGGGFWLGTITNGDTLVSVGYNPSIGTSEIIPTLTFYWRQGYLDTLDKIYKSSENWPPPRTRFRMAPETTLSEVDYWCCFSDSDPNYHFPKDTRPIGIDVALTCYLFSDSLASDFIFLKYQLFNYQNYPINNCYFGIILDADIGADTDDMYGLILNKTFTIPFANETIIAQIKNVCYIYDYDNNENPGRYWESGKPGVVAIRYLFSSLNNQLLNAAKKLSCGNDPRNDQERYLLLAGYNHLTREYQPYDSIDNIPGDKRFLMSVGPFNLSPLDSQNFYFALIAAPHYSQNDTIYLATACYFAEKIFKERILGLAIEEKSTFTKITKNFLSLEVLKNEKEGKIYNSLGKFINPKKKLPKGTYFIKKKNFIKKLIIL